MNIRTTLILLGVLTAFAPLCGQGLPEDPAVVDAAWAEAGAESLFAPKSEAGFQACMVLPQGGVRTAVNGRIGFGLGLHGLVPLDAGKVLRPRFDYTRFDGGALSFSSFHSTLTIEGMGLGADLLAFNDDGHQGVYGVAGAGLVLWYALDHTHEDSRKAAPLVLLGLGSRFDSGLSAELDFECSRFRSDFGMDRSIRLGIFYDFSTPGQ